MSGPNTTVKLPGFLKTITAVSKSPLKSSLTITKPIGLPEAKLYGSKKWSIMAYFSPEAKKEGGKQINYDLKHSQVYEYKSYTNTNGKIFRSPISYFKPDKSLYFPDFMAKNINGQPLHLFKLLSGKVNIIRVYQSVAGAEASESYFKPNDKNYLTTDYHEFIQRYPNAQIIDLNIPTDGLKNFIINMSKANIRKTIPQERQYSSFILPYSIFNHEVREELLCDNSYSGYIYVVDQQGKIRWCTSGKSDDLDMKLFDKVIKGLSKEI